MSEGRRTYKHLKALTSEHDFGKHAWESVNRSSCILNRWEERMTLSIAYIWSNYSDLMRVFTPNGGLVREIPLFQGNHRLVKLKKNWPDICRGSPVNNRATFFPRPRPRDSEKKHQVNFCWSREKSEACP